MPNPPIPQQPMMPVIAPVGIGPNPLPTQFAVGEVMINGEKMVVLQLSTPLGVSFYFFDPASAKQLAEWLSQRGSDIVVARPGLIVPS